MELPLGLSLQCLSTTPFLRNARFQRATLEAVDAAHVPHIRAPRTVACVRWVRRISRHRKAVSTVRVLAGECVEAGHGPQTGWRAGPGVDRCLHVGVWTSLRCVRFRLMRSLYNRRAEQALAGRSKHARHFASLTKPPSWSSGILCVARSNACASIASISTAEYESWSEGVFITGVGTTGAPLFTRQMTTGSPAGAVLLQPKTVRSCVSLGCWERREGIGRWEVTRPSARFVTLSGLVCARSRTDSRQRDPRPWHQKCAGSLT